MSPVRPILSALMTAARRDLRTVGSFSGNNLFLVGVTFLFLGDPGLFATLTAFIGLVIFIPLSADPLRAIPRDRLAVWPLTRRNRLLLRLLSPWLSPITWLIAALALWNHVTVGVCALAGGLFAIGFLLPSLPVAREGLWRRLPSLPVPLNQLIRKNVRQVLSTLDLWGAVLVSLLCLGFRAAMPADALLPMTILVIIALSTYTQTLFGLDGDSGMTRYHLLPVPGWQILAAKDAAFLFISVLLTLCLAPAAGLAAALSALAIGHHASVTHRGDQARWRFSSGASFGGSILQVVVLSAVAAAVHAAPPVLVLCAAVYGWSAWRCGRLFEELPV